MWTRQLPVGQSWGACAPHQGRRPPHVRPQTWKRLCHTRHLGLGHRRPLVREGGYVGASAQDDTPGHRLAADGDRIVRPPWVRLAPFLGRPPALTRRQWRVLGLVAMASFFEMYDLYLFALALKQIQTDLAIPEASLGVLGSLVRFGALPAGLVALVADRIGRRKVLLGTILAYTLFTGATACAPTAQVFVLLQFGARTFAVAETLLAVVVIAEEFD